jgi:hypothetical protein
VALKIGTEFSTIEKGENMKKLVFALVAFAALSFASAQIFTVGVGYGTVLAATVEYAQPVEFGDLLFGVAVVPGTWATEISLGVLVPVASVEGGDFSLAVRGHLPVFDGTSIAVGQAALSGGLVLQVPQDNNVLPTFEAGIRTDVNSAALTTWPGWYVRAGVGFRF